MKRTPANAAAPTAAGVNARRGGAAAGPAAQSRAAQSRMAPGAVAQGAVAQGAVAREAGAKAPAPGGRKRQRQAPLRLFAAAACGGAVIALPVLTATGSTPFLAVAGALLVAGSLVSPTSRSPVTGTLAVAWAVVECVLGRPATAVLAAEGLLLLAYLLLLDAPPGMAGPTAARWLRQQGPAVAAGITASAVVGLVLLVPVPESAWLVVAGVAAAVAAVAVSVPRRHRKPSPPRG